MKFFWTILITCTALSACSVEPLEVTSPIKVEIVQTERGYQLLRGGEPYVVKGVGMGTDEIESLAAHGGNSFRNWSTDNENPSTRELLDTAQSFNVTVALGLAMQPERSGFDYDDADAVAAQLEEFREEVSKYRDHPALLVWIIGNELNHEYTNPRVYDAVEEVSQMIHELDPNHPTTTTMSGVKPDVIAEIQSRAPSLDFISFQVYGGLASAPQVLRDINFRAPFMVTEWGAIGYWEVDKTSWGAPIEATSSEKAATFMRGQQEALTSVQEQLIGSYAFLWGQKQERTPTWFGMFTENGEMTEATDVMHYLWRGSWPDKRSPQVRTFTLDGKSARSSVTLTPGSTVEAFVDAVDPDGDEMSFHWELKRESEAAAVGGDYEDPISNIENLIQSPQSARTLITAPAAGTYRLYVYVYDGNGHAAHANIPFMVEQQPAENLLAGESLAISYSGYREGQHPDRGEGAVNPSDAQILEDLEILAAHNFGLIRLYDSGENSRATLEVIRRNKLPINVLLGIWLKAEFSNHEGCPWLHEPIPEKELATNVLANAEELQRGIALATEFDDLVVAVSVGNEVLVEWNDHMVPVEKVIEYVQQVKSQIEQPVTVADNYNWWIEDGAALASEVDFLGVHTYPAWEGKSIDEALAYTIENIEGVRVALPDAPIAVLEAGWASTAEEFGSRASEVNQARHVNDLKEWASSTNTTVFLFEAFDEPWKGDPDKPLGAEKHWGLFNVDRTSKYVMQESSEIN